MSVRVQFEHQHQSTVDKMYTEIRIVSYQSVTDRTEDIIKIRHAAPPSGSVSANASGRAYDDVIHDGSSDRAR